jgi:pyruvate oxidase
MQVSDKAEPPVQWHHIPDNELPEEGRVRAVVVDGRPVAVSKCGGRIGALSNRCPHQGGPLGDGSIERGLLRCPWHGYDYDPITGQPPAGFSDSVESYQVRAEPDGVMVALPRKETVQRSVADVVIETLVAHGVTAFFGMVGHSNLGLADALRRAEERGDIQFIGIRHEGAAAFAASAYGKLTGRPAACVAIAGPGSTNLLTGLYDAKLDGAPVIALSGQVPSSILGRGAFQDLDLTAAFADVAISTVTLNSASNHSELTALAVKHAVDGRGVAHLVLPDEVQVIPHTGPVTLPTGRYSEHPPAPDPEALANARIMITAARRPVIVVGHGASSAVPDVIELAERLKAPMITTFKAKGLIPDTHPLAGGVLGRSGTPVASWLMNEADLLITMGASFAQHTGIAPYQPIIQIDDRTNAMGRFHAVAATVLGDAATTTQALLRQLAQAPSGALDQCSDVASRWELWREEKRRRATEDRGHGVPAAAVFEVLSRYLPGNALVTVDVGNHAYSLGRYLELAGQRVAMSGYLGSIGFGYPAALGAALAFPEQPVVCVTGDGGFGQYAMEVTTAVRYQLPIKHLLLNNGGLGKISKEQLAANYPVWQTGLTNPDFAQFAELCGAQGRRVRQSGELEGALGWLFANEGPALVAIDQDPDLI